MLTFDFCEKPGKSFSGSKHAAGGIWNQDPQKREILREIFGFGFYTRGNILKCKCGSTIYLDLTSRLVGEKSVKPWEEM